MSSQENSLGISCLFSSNMDEFLQAVFLSLDPASLKNSRRVSSQWNSFIKDRVWDSPVGMERLTEKLKLLWKDGTPASDQQISSQRLISSVKCDMKFVYCCTMEGFIDVYGIKSGSMKYELDCFPDERSEDVGIHLQRSFGMGIILEIGEDIIAASPGRECSDELFIWEKETGEQCYLEKNHDNSHIVAIKSFNKLLVSGASNGSIVLLEESKRREWKLKIKMNDIEYYGEYWLDHLDVEGDWLVTGNGRCIKIWSLAELEEIPVGALPLMVMDISDFDGSDYRRPKLNFVIQFPFIFVIGCESWGGFQIWNGVTGRKIRDIQIEGDDSNVLDESDQFYGLDESATHKRFFHIQSTGDITVLTSEWTSGDAIHLFDTNELCNETIPDEKLWTRVLDVDGDEICGAANKTSLIISDMAGVKIQHFWDLDRRSRVRSAWLTDSTPPPTNQKTKYQAQNSIRNYFHPI